MLLQWLLWMGAEMLVTDETAHLWLGVDWELLDDVMRIYVAAGWSVHGLVRERKLSYLPSALLELTWGSSGR